MNVRLIVKAMLWLAALPLAAAAAAEPGDYLIGGGDTLLVNVWKNTDLSQSVVVRPDGQITLPLIRDVRAAGLTALELGAVLTEKFSAFVNAPNVTVTVSIASGYRVYTQGAIANGMHALAAPITARQLLAQAGGATADADLAHAYIVRRGARVPVDLTISARAPENDSDSPLLEPGDILAIPVREVTLGRILVVGEVVQPHALPYQEGMTILDAYLGAGGGTASADLKNVKVARQREQSGPVEITVDLDKVIKKGALHTNIVLTPGDIVIVPFLLEQRILVVGEVRTQRTLAYREGLTLLDAYVEGGGGSDFADLDSVKVVRTSPDGSRREIHVDLSRVLKRADLAQNIPLAPGDIVVVPR